MYRLEELTDPNRPIRYGIVQPGRFDPDGRYMIRGQDYSESRGWANPGDMFRVSAQVESRYKNARVKAGDLIITIVGAGTGHVEVVPDWLDGANLTQTTARIAIRKDVADPVYCKYLLQSHAGREQVASFVKGNAQPGLNVADVRKFRFKLPPRPDQGAIGARLLAADELIRSLTILISKERVIKQGLMQELLTGRTRLVGFCETWTERTIASLIDGLAAGTSVRSVDGVAQPAVLKTSAVRGGKFDSREVKTILPQDVSRASCVPVADSLIISRMNTPAMVGDVGYVEKEQPGLYLPDRLWLARPRPGSGTSMRWLAALLSHGETAQSVRDLATGTSNSMKNIPKTRLLSLHVSTPPSDEQHAIAEVLRDVDAEIAALERRLEATRAIKQGMMQKLLTKSTRMVTEGAA
ncbi:restriction endonuclease subunit S [Nonomuraea aurantiaca]|uniref:restriction endonuclease subunit S n=1 Tax=Nonomuraea aurantiaca TaxID=2878562 RepID=UPI001CD96335|nr:restriction endonuclease subunit S [Nonomuraea aurantiaca]